MRRLAAICLALVLLGGCSRFGGGQEKDTGEESSDTEVVVQDWAGASDAVYSVLVGVAALGDDDCVTLGDVEMAEGNILSCDIRFDGEGNVEVGLVPQGEDPMEAKPFFSMSSFGGNALVGSSQAATGQEAGSYTLYIRTLESAEITNVVGTVEVREG